VVLNLKQYLAQKIDLCFFPDLGYKTFLAESVMILIGDNRIRMYFYIEGNDE
jgi:hypothetical protein